MRNGVILIMFDLPVKKSCEKKEYSKFRRFLLQEGFLLLQNSVYVKNLKNISISGQEYNKIKANAPTKGNVVAFTLSQNQFKDFNVIIGETINYNIICEPIIYI